MNRSFTKDGAALHRFKYGNWPHHAPYPKDTFGHAFGPELAYEMYTIAI